MLTFIAIIAILWVPYALYVHFDADSEREPEASEDD
jgi:hypothetical protein